MVLSGRHAATLRAVFAEPVKGNLAWRDIEALLVACGAELSEGSGSRVRVALHGIRAVFHRPHPRKEASKGTVRSIRRLLNEAGISP
jgi:hypothetical protein